MTPQLFREVGEMLAGPDWQSPVARLLGPLHPTGPRPMIDVRLVQRWAAGARPIPEWVPPALGRLVTDAIPATEQRLDAMRRIIPALLSQQDAQ